MQKSAERAAMVVQDLLVLARRKRYTMASLNLNDLLQDYLSSIDFAKLRRHYASVELATKMSAKPLMIFGSHSHLTNVVMKTIKNAFEATPEGGRIEIATDWVYLDKSVRQYEKLEKGEYVLLSISDNGEGISEQDIDRIFEPFYSKKKMGSSGSGLGLAVVYGVIQDHGGYIDVKSALGRGSTFTFYFPLSRKGRPDVTAVNLDIKGTESVLVVDDVEEQRDLAHSLLGSLGYYVTTVASGEEAVAYLTSNTADVVVLDMILEGGIDGLETYKRIIDIRPGQKAVIVSGFTASSQVKEAQRLGAGIYVQKPYTMEMLGQAVRAELDK